MVKISQKRLDTLYEKNKDKYKVETHTYPSGTKIELWKKNKRYGYYNFIDYIPTTVEEDIKNKIIEDILKGDKNEKSKR